jgi:glycerate dehydrogenase
MDRELPRVVLLDAATYGDASLESFTQWPCAIHPFSPPETVASRLERNQIAVVNKVILDGSLLRSPSAKDLKLIAVAATGTDNVNLDAARSVDIGVCNVPGYATQAVAQFTMALVLELATRSGSYIELVRRGAWERSQVFTLFDYPSTELAGRTLGIVGYGSIGKLVAKMAEPFGLNVLLCARPGTPGPPPQGRVSFEELLGKSDFITLHCPLTDATKNLIDTRAIALIKPGAFLINTARGGLIDTPALLKALKDGSLAGAALDVLTREPPPPDHPLIEAAKKLPNLLITPHCAWATREARQRLLTEVAENIVAFTRGARRNRVV